MRPPSENVGRVFPSSPWSSSDEVSTLPPVYWSRAPSTSGSTLSPETPRRASYQLPMEEKDITACDDDTRQGRRRYSIPLLDVNYKRLLWLKLIVLRDPSRQQGPPHLRHSTPLLKSRIPCCGTVSFPRLLLKRQRVSL